MLKKTQLHKILIYISIFIGAIIILVAPLIHIGFDTKNKTVENFKDEISLNVEIIDSKIKSNRLSYDQGKISPVSYIEINDSLNKERKAALKSNSAQITEITNANRVFGWKTWRSFLIGFGIRLPYLLFSLIISYLVAVIRDKNKDYKISLQALQVACYTISFYVIIWCFWSSQDYPLETYWYAMALFCIFPAIIATYFFRYFKSYELRVTIIKRGFIKTLVSLKHQYRKTLKRAIKAEWMDSIEQKEIKQESHQFDKTITNEANNLI